MKTVESSLQINLYDYETILRKLEEIVCTKGCDAGVILLSGESTTHYVCSGERTIQVYDHPYFSPLGCALIDLYRCLHAAMRGEMLPNYPLSHPPVKTGFPETT